MRIFLIRHGQSMDNVEKIIAGHGSAPLSKLGKKQAQILGRKFMLNRVKVNAIYSSDLVRAEETAKIICKEIEVNKIQLDKRFREVHTGKFTGRPIASFTAEERKIFDKAIENLDFKIIGGESNIEMNTRIREAFNEITEKHPIKSTLLLIGHSGTLYHILIKCLKLLSPQQGKWHFGNCKINIIEKKLDDSPWELIKYNCDDI